MVTDIGIELGRLLYWNRTPDSPEHPAVRANLRRLRLHLSLVLMFFLGWPAGCAGLQAPGLHRHGAPGPVVGRAVVAAVHSRP